MNNRTIFVCLFFSFESFFSRFYPTFLKSHIAAVRGTPRSAISTAPLKRAGIFPTLTQDTTTYGGRPLVVVATRLISARSNEALPEGFIRLSSVITVRFKDVEMRVNLEGG